MAKKKSNLKPTQANLLTAAQKRLIDASFETIDDIHALASYVFNSESLKIDGDEVKAIKRYLAGKKKDEESDMEGVFGINFTQDQIDYIVKEISSGSSTVEVAKVLFPKFRDLEYRKINFTSEAKAIVRICKDRGVVTKRHQAVTDEYKPIRTTSQAIRKIISITGDDIDEERLDYNSKLALTKMISKMASKGFVRLINGFTKQEDRDVFEEAFIQNTWNKPDLTPEDYELYMGLAQNVVQRASLLARNQQIRDDYERRKDEDEASEATIRASKEMETVSKAIKECGDAINAIVSKVQKARSERKVLDNTKDLNIVKMVEFFREKKNREEAAKLYEMSRDAASDELNKFDQMDDIFGRILGVSRDSII